MEALNPQAKGKASPSPNSIPSSLPEENSNGATGHASDYRREDKHATESLAWRVDGSENSELEDENYASK